MQCQAWRVCIYTNHLKTILFYLCTVDQVGAQDKNGKIILIYTLPSWKFSTIHCFLHLVALLSPQFCTTLFFDLPAKQPSFEPLHHLNGIKQDIQFLAGIQTNLEQNFLWFSALNFNSRALSCTQRACSRAPWVRKLGYLYIQEFLVLNHVTVCTPVRTTYHTNVK